MPVLYGVFFYMGFSALRGMQVCRLHVFSISVKKLHFTCMSKMTNNNLVFNLEFSKFTPIKCSHKSSFINF